MSSELLEMYETLTDERREEVNNLIHRLLAQQSQLEQNTESEWEKIFATADIEDRKNAAIDAMFEFANKLKIASTEKWSRDELYTRGI